MIRGPLSKPKVSSIENWVFFGFANGFEDIVASLEALTVSDVDEAASGKNSLVDHHFGLYWLNRLRNLE